MTLRIFTVLATGALAGLSLGCDYGSSDDEGPKGGGTPVDCSAATGNALLECQVVALVNQQRAQGATCTGKSMPAVPPLELHSTLQTSARAHAEDMAQNNYFSHDNQKGQSPFDRMEAAGYAFSSAGENIAAGSSSPEKTMQQWLQSTDGHCENIMKGSFVHIGVGYAFSDGAQFKHYWVQNFGKP
jgi:uncharacterized protein YkwD